MPTGSFYVRMYATIGTIKSATASNEIRIHLNVPVTPSAPANLLGLVNGSTLALAWKNTFVGGAPTSVILDVTGSLSGSFPLGVVDAASFVGAPGGTYTLSLRATNGGGASSASNAVVVTLPGVCTGAPLTPTNFLAYKIGSTVYVVWDPAASGPAPTSYTLSVTGSYVGSFGGITSRSFSSPAPPGSYGLSVAATNGCGASAATAAQTVTIP